MVKRVKPEGGSFFINDLGHVQAKVLKGGKQELVFAGQFDRKTIRFD